jgi:hypothetical protein
MAEEGEEKGWSRAGKGRAVWLSSGAAAYPSAAGRGGSREMERGREEEGTEYGDGSSGSGDARPWLRLQGYAGSVSAARRAAGRGSAPKQRPFVPRRKGGSASSCFCGRVPELT